MATLATIMRVRKLALGNVLARMRMLDSAQEEVERFIRRLMKRRNKLPTTNELNKIIRSCSVLDRLLENIIKAVNTAMETFKTSADVESTPNISKIEGLKPADINRWAKQLREFLQNMSNQLPTSGLGGGSEQK